VSVVPIGAVFSAHAEGVPDLRVVGGSVGGGAEVFFSGIILI